MPGCPYFIGNTFAHLLGGLLVTGISSENPLVSDIETKPMTHLSFILFTFFLLFSLLYSPTSPFKYGLFAFYCYILGQTLSGFVKRLQQENVLSSTMVTVGVIFSAMTLVGFLDRGNLLGIGVYLYAGLAALILATLFSVFFIKDKKEASTVHLWISRLIVLLFTVYIAFDVQILKLNAKLCKSNPDYINESLNLYLDVLNLFTGVGSSLSSN